MTIMVAEAVRGWGRLTSDTTGGATLQAVIKHLWNHAFLKPELIAIKSISVCPLILLFALFSLL